MPRNSKFHRNTAMRLTQLAFASLGSATLMGATPTLGSSQPSWESWDMVPDFGSASTSENIQLSFPRSTDRNMLRATPIQDRRKLSDSDSDSSDDGTRTVIVGTDDDNCNDEDPDYSTITEALIRERSGVTLQLCAEVYNESVVIPLDYAVKIRGVGRGLSFIRPPTDEAGFVIGAGINSTVELEKLTLDGVNGLNGSAIVAPPDRFVFGFFCDDCDASLNEVKIKNIRDTFLNSSMSADVYVRSFSSFRDYQIRVIDSIFPNPGTFGTFVAGSALSGEIKHNNVTRDAPFIFEDEEIQTSIGIEVSRQANVVVEGNTVRNFDESGTGIALFCQGQATEVITNQIDSAGVGILLLNSISAEIEGNAISNGVKGGFGVLLRRESNADPGCAIGPDVVDNNNIEKNEISCEIAIATVGVGLVSDDDDMINISNNVIDSNSIAADCAVGIGVSGNDNAVKNNTVAATVPYIDNGDGTMFMDNIPMYTPPPTPAP